MEWEFKIQRKYSDKECKSEEEAVEMFINDIGSGEIRPEKVTEIKRGEIKGQTEAAAILTLICEKLGITDKEIKERYQEMKRLENE